MDIIDIAEDTYKKTLFLATNAIDVLTLARLGWVNYGAIVNIETSDKVHFESCYLHTFNQQHSISLLPEMKGAKQYIKENISKFDYIWTFRPYEWLDDFILKNKKVLCNSYFKYIAISRKLHQDRMLYMHGDSVLREHIEKKDLALDRDIFITSDFEKQNKTKQNKTKQNKNERLYFAASSTGCSGVYKGIVEEELEKNLFAKSDLFINPSIPVCQNAVIVGNDVVKYQPKISIVKSSGKSLQYLGGDYKSAESILNEDIISRISVITHHVCLTLKEMGFYGVVNCDYLYMAERNDFLFVEVNPRYSACTFILDEYFSRNKKDLMPSVLHALSFSDEKIILKNTHLKEFIGPKSYIKLSFNDEACSFIKTPPSNKKKAQTKLYKNPIVKDPVFPVTLIDPLEVETW